LLLAGGDAILVGIHPEVTTTKAASEREVIPVGVDGITLNEEGAIGVLASGCSVYEFCNDLLVCHGGQ